MHKAVRYIFILVCWLSVVGFLSGLSCNLLSILDIPLSSSIIRVPLGSPGGIAVDSKGRIYCLAGFYNRMQVYDKEGRFLTGWSVKAVSRIVNIFIDDNDNIHVETGCYEKKHPIVNVNRKVYTVFDSNGKLLEKRNETFSSVKKVDVLGAKDDDGNVYRIKDYWLFPKIIKITPSGEETIVISDPFYLWFIKGPLPTGGFILCALIIGGIMELRKWIKKKKAEANLPAENASTD